MSSTLSAIFITKILWVKYFKRNFKEKINLMVISLFPPSTFCNLNGVIPNILDYNISMQPEIRQVVFPLIYGSIAFSMGKRSQTTTNTHKWICYVRGANNQDLSYLIRKVEFVLHSSFDEPVKTVDKPPFEVKKEGWGEFEIFIRIYFQHPNMPHIEVPHFLKLHHSHTTAAQAAKKPLCSETYDEIVFTQIDEHIQKMVKGKQVAPKLQPIVETQALMDEGETVNPQQPLRSIIHYSKYFTELKPQQHKQKLTDAYNYIVHEIKNSEDKLKMADFQLQKVYDQIYGS